MGSFRLGPVVVSFHRSEQEKEDNPGVKERWYQLHEPHHKATDTLKPRVQLSLGTPYNLLPTAQDVDKALAALPFIREVGPLVSAVRNMFAAHLAEHGELPKLVIVGEHHTSAAALMIILAVLHEYRDTAGPKVIMFERTPDKQHDYSRTLASQPSGRMRNCLARNRPLGFGARFDFPDEEDLHHGNTLPASNVTIMVGGTLHVPTLHEKLSPLVSTLTLAMVPSQLNPTDHPMMKERLSYVVKARGVQAFKVDDQLRTETWMR